MLKVDGDRFQFNLIYNHVQRSGKQYQNHSDDTQGHMLLVEYNDTEYEGVSNIEYLVDCSGC